MAQGRGTAIVTGGGSGVGKASALALQRAGWNVVICGRRREALDATAAVSQGRDAQIMAVVCDVTDAGAVEGLFGQTVATFGRIDVVFNNAGIFPKPTPIEDISLEEWQSGVAVNLTGAFLVAQAAFRAMKRQSPQGGRIINNGSISAYVPRPRSLIYTTTKHAITGLTKSISLDGRASNIACSQIDIGNAATELTAAMATGLLQADGTVRPEPRMDVAHVADAVVYIAGLPLSANVQFMTVMATAMPFIGRG
jgi:NAD(P)-dependent dehydrogenase (short-subunit alcohol dehydrogenase family)